VLLHVIVNATDAYFVEELHEAEFQEFGEELLTLVDFRNSTTSFTLSATPLLNIQGYFTIIVP
jgi:hypothetical protein